MLLQIANNAVLQDTGNLLYDINNFKPPKDWNNTYTQKNILTDTVLEKNRISYTEREKLKLIELQE